MKCNILIPSAAAASRSIIGAEIADNLQTTAALQARPGVTINDVNYRYNLVEISSDVDEFLNNYNQFYFSGTAVYKSANYAVNNRRLYDSVAADNPNYFDRSVPYAENMIHSLG